MKDFRDFAKTPPMGWNSWDCFGAGVTEEELIENVDYMAEKLKPFGWEYIVCDIQWYEPKAKGNDYNSFADLVMDEYGRLLPAKNRFPSAAYPEKYYYGLCLFDGTEEGNTGFRVIADYVHSKGLKFGIHILRGIPRQAVALDLPVFGSEYSAREIAHPFSVCSWNTDMYGLKNCWGAQDYYDSIISMYASWGVDFIKCDDTAVTEFSRFDRPYSADYEIEMIRKAIDKTGCNIVLSLSPGPARVEDAAHLKANANMWRMTGDFWDSWDKLRDMFDRCRAWDGIKEPGNYPDCDMLPLGVLCKDKSYLGEQNRKSRFTDDEVLTMLSLWGIFGSPLILGGNLPETDEKTLALLTNEDFIKMVKTAYGGKEVFRDESVIVRTAKGENGTLYTAIFNIGEEAAFVDVHRFFPKEKPFDIWKGKESKKNAAIPPHGVLLLK